MSSESDAFLKLKGGEIAYGYGHPWRVPMILWVRNKAYNRAYELYEEWSQEDGTGDAFRHAYAAALLAREFSPSESAYITTLHESGDNNPTDRKAMDLHNNNVGINVYKEEKFECYGDREPSDEELEAAVMKAIREGRMIILVWSAEQANRR
jgi:hypothetical protein